MMKLIKAILPLTIAAVMTIPAAAGDYNFGSGGSSLSGFGTSTSTDTPVTPDTMSANIRRNKDAAYLPPPYFYGSGDIPTELSSLYHSSSDSGGFVPQAQNIPATGGESYAPGSDAAAATVSEEMLTSTSQTDSLNTAPWYYDDGSIGTLSFLSVNKTVKVYEGESPDNMMKGAGHFSSTSAWDGNVGIAGHNRGVPPAIGFVKDLSAGDRITYTTRYGTRTYEVYAVDKVSVSDTSSLGWTENNTLTIITCVENVPELRYCVKAVEIQ
ncbi:hypothetical protein FACS1894219_04940 [Clostridia bacterium]|nr:hypothetical protein FACS1894219_04940 [Clostridia bacterium]